MFFISPSRSVEKDRKKGTKMYVLSWFDLEADAYTAAFPNRNCSCWLDQACVMARSLKGSRQFNLFLDLSLILCYLFLSNYDFNNKKSPYLSEIKGCSDQLWASLVHYKSRF